MCTSTSTKCKHCTHTRQHITLCDTYKAKQNSLPKVKGYNYKDCGDLKEVGVDVDAFDGEHDYPAEFRERMRRYGMTDSTKDEEKNGEKRNQMRQARERRKRKVVVSACRQMCRSD